MAEITVCYPGAFLLAFGHHRFDVYIGDALVRASSGYRHSWQSVVAMAPGGHRLEVRAINRITGGRRSHFFNFAIPHEGSYRLHLGISHAWGTWREPRLEIVSPSNKTMQPTGAPSGAGG